MRESERFILSSFSPDVIQNLHLKRMHDRNIIYLLFARIIFRSIDVSVKRVWRATYWPRHTSRQPIPVRDTTRPTKTNIGERLVLGRKFSISSQTTVEVTKLTESRNGRVVLVCNLFGTSCLLRRLDTVPTIIVPFSCWELVSVSISLRVKQITVNLKCRTIFPFLN